MNDYDEGGIFDDGFDFENCVRFSPAEARFNRLVRLTREEYGPKAAESVERIKAATLHAISTRASDGPPPLDISKITTRFNLWQLMLKLQQESKQN